MLSGLFHERADKTSRRLVALAAGKQTHYLAYFLVTAPSFRPVFFQKRIDIFRFFDSGTGAKTAPDLLAFLVVFLGACGAKMRYGVRFFGFFAF